MSLITCPVCGRKITDNAESCIGCGLSMAWVKRMQLDKPWSKRHIRCIVCGTDYELSDCLCPKCGYPAIYLSPDLDLQESKDACRKDYEARRNIDRTVADDVGSDVDYAMPLIAEPEDSERPVPGEEKKSDVTSGEKIQNLRTIVGAQKTRIVADMSYNNTSTTSQNKRLFFIIGVIISLLSVVFIITLIARQPIYYSKTSSTTTDSKSSTLKDDESTEQEKSASDEETSTTIVRHRVIDHYVFLFKGYYDPSSESFIKDDDYETRLIVYLDNGDDHGQLYDEGEHSITAEIWISDFSDGEYHHEKSYSDSEKLTSLGKALIKKYDLSEWENEEHTKKTSKDGYFFIYIPEGKLAFAFYYSTPKEGTYQIPIFGSKIADYNDLREKAEAVGFYLLSQDSREP